MSQNIIDISDTEIIRLGKDEMNLIEHPFGSLSKEKDTRNIELHWKTRHPISKKILDAYWKVRGDADLGLPTANDEKVYLVAMELTRASGWEREIRFTRTDFLRRLGWTDNNEAYRRLNEAFLRLAGVLIEAKNAFYHPQSGHYVDGGFHLIDTFMIAGEGPGRKSRERLNQPLTYFVWNKIVHESFIAGNIRSLDLGFALSLDRPLSLRLFRYLDKKRYGGRETFEVGLRELCGVHLGMVIDDRYDSNLKASLKAAHDELIGRGFLLHAEYEKMKTRKGSKVIYVFAGGDKSATAIESGTVDPIIGFSEAEVESEQLQLHFPDSLPSLFAEPDAPIPEAADDDTNVAPPVAETVGDSPEIESLTALGVSPSVVQELCKNFSAQQIRLQIDCLHDRDPKNPAATLVNAIRQGWSEPPSYTSRLKAAEGPEKSRTGKESISRSQRAERPLERPETARLELERAAEAAHLDEMWEKLDLATRERIEKTAKERLGILGQSGRAQAALAAMKRTLLREMTEKQSADLKV